MEFFNDNINTFLEYLNMDPSHYPGIRAAISVLIVMIVFGIFWFVTKEAMVKVVKKITEKTPNKFDDALLHNKFFSAIAYLITIVLFENVIKILLVDFPQALTIMVKFFDILVVFIIMIASNRALSAVLEILNTNDKLKDKPVTSYIQLAKILVAGIFIIIMLSILTNKNPIYFFSGLGAVSAILILIFKDTILGFIGSIQLAVNDMVRIGDWITMEKFGADGFVIEINLATVKVQNWDKTITTIPTYSFVSDSFKNWRGMFESGGRRIKRSIFIKIDSIRFCTEEMLSRFKEFELIDEYLMETEEMIRHYNTTNNINSEVIINGKRQTNIGLFRKYALNYLRHIPEINQEMIIMVRQLQPTEKGLPIEIYCFTADTRWISYENVQSDIFDHLLAAIRYFDLEVFEYPSGKDLKSLVEQGGR